MRTAEEMVRTNLKDASQIETGVRDCDDNAAGYVTFTTDLKPSLARDAFAADPACARDDEDTTTFGVSCTSPTGSLYVSFDIEDGATVGVVDF